MSDTKKPHNESAAKRFVAFDLLRLVAATLVVVTHFAFSSHSVERTTLHSSLMSPVIRYAFVSVDVFFIISGYFIMMTAFGRTWREFLIVRFARLIPPVAVCATITFVGCLILAPYSYRSIGVLDWLANVTGVILIPGLGRLFERADVVYWTLQIEAVFYLIVAIGLALRTTPNRLLAVMLGLCFSSAVISQFVSKSNMVLYVGETISRFVVGGALCLLSRAPRSKSAWVLFGGGMVLMMQSTWKEAIARVNLEHVVFNPWIACGTLAAWVAVMLFITFRPIRFELSWSEFAGGFTLPLYLVHHQLGCTIANAMGLGDTIAGVLGLTAAMILFAAFIHRAAEIPLVPRFRRLLNAVFLPRPVAKSAQTSA